MRIYYSTIGRIATVVLSKDFYVFNPSVLVRPDLYIDIDENVNIPLVNDIIRIEGRINMQGQEKYYISGGQLYSRDNWKEFKI